MKLSKYTTFLLFVAVNTPASLAIDVVWEPTELILGVPTEVRFYIQANDEDFAPAGGGISISDVNDGTPLPSAVPDGGLFFDLDGPDDIDFTGDDGWKWQGGIDGSQGFTTQVNPPEFIYFGVIGNSPFVVPAGTRLLAASLVITGTELGAFRLAPIYTLFDESFNEVPVKDGLETVFDVVEGSGRLGACCFDDGTCTVAGLGACVGGPANWFEERECDVCSIEPSEPCDEACGDIDHWMHDPACQPGVDRLDSSIVTFGLSFSPNDEDCSVDAIVRTRGTSWINTFGPMDDSSRYPDTRALDEHLDVRDTEVVSIDTISPDGLVRMTAGRDRGAAALRPSYGTLAEQPAEPALADGFFDLYTEIEVLRDDGEVLVRLYNQDPARVEAVVDCIPAEANYRSSPGCIALYTSPIDGEGVHVANLVSAEYRTFEATCFETIGGAVYADCDDVITSGETNVQVTVAGTEGNYVAVTSGPSGVWSIPFVPCGEYVVTPHRVFREYCHVEPGGACPSTLCATSTQITVDADHRGPNLSVQFVGLPDCITNDMNYDELCTVTFDADLFVQCVYDGDCVGPDGEDLVCPADGNCDGFATIVFDADILVHNIYEKGVCGSCSDEGVGAESSRRSSRGTRAGFTIGGAVYANRTDPLSSGIQGVGVQVFGPDRRVVATATTAGSTGIWRVDGLPEGTYSVVFGGLSRTASAGQDVISILVNPENEAANLSLRLLRSPEPMRRRQDRRLRTQE